MKSPSEGTEMGFKFANKCTKYLQHVHGHKKGQIHTEFYGSFHQTTSEDLFPFFLWGWKWATSKPPLNSTSHLISDNTQKSQLKEVGWSADSIIWVCCWTLHIPPLVKLQNVGCIWYGLSTSYIFIKENKAYTEHFVQVHAHSDLQKSSGKLDNLQASFLCCIKEWEFNAITSSVWSSPRSSGLSSPSAEASSTRNKARLLCVHGCSR